MTGEKPSPLPLPLPPPPPPPPLSPPPSPLLPSLLPPPALKLATALPALGFVLVPVVGFVPVVLPLPKGEHARRQRASRRRLLDEGESPHA